MELVKKLTENAKIRIIAMIVSYGALLFLLMPATIIGIVSTALLLTLGVILFVWKKPWPEKPHNSIYIYSALSAIAFIIYFGIFFHNRWIHSSQIKTLASKFYLSSHMFLLIAAIILSVFAFLFIQYILSLIIKILITVNKKCLFIKDLLWCLIASATIIFLTQGMIGEYTIFMVSLKFFLGTVAVGIVIFLFYCLFGTMKVAVTIGTGIFMLMSIVNVYVYNFRERLFEPVDILSFGTAMNVADNYSFFPIPNSVIIGLIIWGSLIFSCFFAYSKSKYIPSFRKRIALLVCCVIGGVCVFSYTANIKTYHWQKEGAKFNGYILNFVAELREMYVAEPDGYSLEQVSKEADKYAEKTEASESTEDPPHIFVIMNEAFSDLSVFGEISTNKEVTPFISSLKENTVSGYALASVYGGNTANSEYEFLTGNSMAWLAPNAVPYQQYLKSPTYSMVSYLKTKYDYQCIAMHPYLSSGWNRPMAYSNLGFDECLFIEEFPQKNYIREYISDQEMFEKIIDVYEAQNDDPLFLMGVSMQNHGDYIYSGENYSQSISLVGYDNSYPDVEQYLSLIHETDRAVEKLISYFSEADDKVVIVFYGDHQPMLNKEFYNEVNKNASNSLAEQQKKHTVPFFIWANYDLEEKYVECTSLNYLSSYVYDAAGITLPPYNQFLSEMEDVIPAINANGFYSESLQSYLAFENASEKEREWLELYEQLQYNSFSGAEKRSKKLFPIVEK